MGKLYVVATPIGNLQDVSLRSLRVLAEVGLIVAEDTRTARVLLAHHGVHTPLLSYDDHNAKGRVPQILGRLAEMDVALVTDAGTPAISDPGVDLVAAAHEAGIEVVAVPGPSAVVAALSIAGLRSASFRFVGFLPRAAGELQRLLESHAGNVDTLVAYESPQRVRKSLQAIEKTMPARRMAVCRELTKVYEEVFLGTAAEALAHFETPRGEFVLLIEGAGEGESAKPPEDEAVVEEVAEMRRLGLSRSQASALLTRRFGLSRRRVYELWLESEERSEER